MRLNRPIRPCIAVLLLLFARPAHTQPASQATLPYFQSPRLALLFGVASLDLSNYEGGIGIGFRQSDNMYWRVSLGLSASYSSNDWGAPHNSRVHSSTSSTSYAPSLSVAPLLLLLQDDPAFLFLSPCLGIGYNHTFNESTYLDSAGTNGARGTDKDVVFSAGCSLGGGVSITRRIVLSAEYRLAVSNTSKASSRSNVGYDGTEIEIYLSETHGWYLRTAAILTLQYQL
jgi:hypothetical protein